MSYRVMMKINHEPQVDWSERCRYDLLAHAEMYVAEAKRIMQFNPRMDIEYRIESDMEE